MRKFTLLIAFALTASSAHAATIFLKREYVTGTTKQCIYDYYGSDYIVTIQSYQLCKLSITI
jgi:hypothetical protein